MKKERKKEKERKKTLHINEEREKVLIEQDTTIQRITGRGQDRLESDMMDRARAKVSTSKDPAEQLR